MANVTPTNLTSAATPVAGTDIALISRDGTVVSKVSLTDFMAGLTMGINTAAPNATTPVQSFTATNTGGQTYTNIDVAIVPKGTGAFSLQVADNALTGGNKRGANAVDLQTSRTAATQVASGNFSFVVGQSNTASGTLSVAMGSACSATGIASFAAGNGAQATNTSAVALGSGTASGVGSFVSGNSATASGINSIAMGANSSASGDQSIALARFATTNGIQGQVALGHNSNLSGGYQTTLTGLRQVTTGTTATRATADGATAATANQLTLRNNSVFIVEGSVVAYDLTTLDAASFTISALIKRGANAGTTALVGTPVITRDFNDTAAATWAVTVVADTTNGAFGVNVQGAGANQIRWFVELYTQETGV